jgi:predicted membrane protein
MTGKIIIGSILVLLGLSLFLDQLGIFEFDYIAGNFWPIILIILGLMQIFQKQGSKVWGILLTSAGLVFAGVNLDILPGSVMNYFWPLVLVFVGLWVMFSRSKTISDTQSGSKERSSQENISLNAIAAGLDIKNNNQNFQGGFINSIFGSVDLDLTKASLGESKFAELDITCLFAGVDIRIPEDWLVEVNATPVLGAVENKARQVSGKEDIGESPILQIRGLCMFGAIEIKN